MGVDLQNCPHFETSAKSGQHVDVVFAEGVPWVTVSVGLAG